MKVLPSFGRLSTDNLAPCRSAIHLTRLKPSPAPSAAADRAGSPRKKRSKTCGSASGAMPTPVSRTSSTASEPSVATRTEMRPPSGVNLIALSRRLSNRRSSQLGVAENRDVVGGVGRKGNALRLRNRIELLDDRHGQRGQIHRRARQRDLAGLRSGERQQLADETRECVQLFELVPQSALIVFRVTGLHQRELGLSSQDGQWRPQLVSDGCAELTHLGDRLLEPGERLVEGVRDLVELVSRAAERDATPQARDVDAARGLRHPCKRRQGTRRHPASEDQRQESACRQAPEEQPHETPPGTVDRVERYANL